MDSFCTPADVISPVRRVSLPLALLTRLIYHQVIQTILFFFSDGAIWRDYSGKTGSQVTIALSSNDTITFRKYCASEKCPLSPTKCLKFRKKQPKTVTTHQNQRGRRPKAKRRLRLIAGNTNIIGFISSKWKKIAVTLYVVCRERDVLNRLLYRFVTKVISDRLLMKQSGRRNHSITFLKE